MNSPYSQYPSAHQDVFNSLNQSAFAARDLAGAQKQSELSKQAKEFSQRYALQGLQNEIDAQNQKNNLAQSRLDGMFGPMSSLLRGLYE